MRVNLLPYQEEQKTGPRWATVFTLVGLVLLMAVTIVFYLALEGQVRSYEERVATVKRDYAGYTAALERRAYLEQLQIEHAQKSAFISELSGEGVKWNRIMDELRKIIPQTVVLDSVEATGEVDIVIKGRAGSIQAIVQFMVNIQSGKTVDRPDLRTATWNHQSNAFLFHLTCEALEVSPGG